MNKRMYFMLSLLLVMTTSLKAQVVIGTNAAEPVASAVLDLNSGIDGNMGLLLPRVPLIAEDDATTIPSPATGLMVYATGTDGLAAGVYVWDGTKWVTAKSSIAADIAVTAYDLTPNTEVDVYIGNTKDFTASNFMPNGTASYPGVTWNITAGSTFASITSYTMTTATISGLTEGIATLTVSTLDRTLDNKTVTLHVLSVTLKSFSLPPTLNTIASTGPATISASNFLDNLGGSLTDVTVDWDYEGSTLPAGTTVAYNGNTATVTPGTTAGTFTLHARAGGETKNCVVTIKDPAAIAEPNPNYKPSLQGITCFDVRPDQDDPAAEPRVYTVVENGTTSTIQSVIWGVTPSSTSLLNSYAVSTTPCTKDTLNFKNLATLQSVANPTAQTVVLTALIEYADGHECIITKTIKIQYEPCCGSDGILRNLEVAGISYPTHAFATGDDNGVQCWFMVGPNLYGGSGRNAAGRTMRFYNDNNVVPAQACPSEWHVPSKTEADRLNGQPYLLDAFSQSTFMWKYSNSQMSSFDETYTRFANSAGRFQVRLSDGRYASTASTQNYEEQATCVKDI
ncbi:MAG: hypothetical protein LBO74_09970 [Candidatus Symbiothrix sp.]|nr:hypothetical protein [Candidatus Symbiothrix sp.]